MLLLKLGWRDSGYSSNSIMTVPHIPAAAHGYVFLNASAFQENGGNPFSLANLMHPTRTRLTRYRTN